MKVSISNGELLDKVTIIKLKMENIKDPTSRDSVRREHDELVRQMMILTDTISDKNVEEEYLRLYDQLFMTNEKLWLLEDRIREKEKRNVFDYDFIEIARSIYYTNDVRTSIKKEINELTQSLLVEVKSYSEY
tara:strand:- start:2178 stop:2576 length:399 start_codon:yes stop_codon:yes gene_type:complete